jgi:RNase H
VELFAIYYSLLYITSTETLPNITICTDSLSSIQSLQNNNSKTNQYWVTQIHEIVTSHGCNVNLIWVPSHINILGNERADKLAGQATKNPSIDITLPLEIKEIDPFIKTYINRKSQEEWNNSSSTYKEIQPQISNQPFFTHPCRKTEVCITRLQLGRCKLNHYIHQLDPSVSSLCNKCGKEETIHHFLLQCRDGVGAGVKQYCDDNKITPSIGNILNDPVAIRIIIANNDRKI